MQQARNAGEIQNPAIVSSNVEDLTNGTDQELGFQNDFYLTMLRDIEGFLNGRAMVTVRGNDSSQAIFWRILYAMRDAKVEISASRQLKVTAPNGYYVTGKIPVAREAAAAEEESLAGDVEMDD